MPSLRLTAKRQATFPLATCESLGLKPGDTLELELRDDAAGRVWVLRPRPARARKWIGSVGGFAGKSADHSMEAVRASIVRGRTRPTTS